ncbi:hypothetical protein FRC07_001958 [Ceratobasidium sp. 392]|nr:hypothetical protein FRC07_001958 [Ceratobasidium sp. 392]
MESIEAWALGQLKRVLQSSEKLALEVWDNNSELLDALVYSKLLADREVEHNIRNLVQYYSYYLDPDADPEGHYKHEPEHLARLYRYPLLKIEDPALFGYVFCCILKAGHDSALWECLNRDERAQVFAALVYLTPLPSTLPISWIQDTSEISEVVATDSRDDCFDDCAESFLDFFSEDLTCSKLSSDSLRAGVSELSELPNRRLLLEQRVRSAECTCTKQLLEVIDLKMDALFTELAEKYHGCLE